MIKKLLFLFACTLATVVGFAQSGDFGENNALHWKFANGILTISGIGAMPNYTPPSVTPWNGHRSKITQAIIQEGVTSIGEGTFYNYSGLASVTIGNDVTSIERNAFAGCVRLTSVTIGSSVTSIKDAVFGGCSSLNSVTCRALEPPTDLGAATFLLVDKTTCKLYVPIGCKEKYEVAARWSEFLQIEEAWPVSEPHWEFADGTLTISGTNIMMPDYTPSSVPPWYDHRSQITKIVIQDGIAGIGGFAFYMCEALTSVTVPNSVTRIGEYAFAFCSDLASITIPNSVTSIESLAFSGCLSLTSLTIPNSVTKIGNDAFSHCKGLTSVTIGNGVMNIGSGAFLLCNSLTSVTIGSGVTRIREWAFADCLSLTSLTCHAPEPPITYMESTFDGINKLLCTLYVSVDSKKKYRTAYGWSEFFMIEEDFPVSVEPAAMAAQFAPVVYPNPVQDYFYVGGMEESTPVTLLDISGKTVLQTVAHPGEAVPVAHLLEGVYIIQIAGKAVRVVKN